MNDEKDNDIELLAGQVWMAPDNPMPANVLAMMKAMEDEAHKICGICDVPAGRPEWAQRALAETMRFLKPQADIVRHPIPPELSENTHEAPHYSDLLPKKGGVE